jgi:hypothetical protein
MVHASISHPGWQEGWAVVKGSPHRWSFAGIYNTEAEAETALAAKGEDYTVRWGLYYPPTDEFVTGDPD